MLIPKVKTTPVKIGNKMVGEEYPCFMVAEIGINHNGDLEIAKKLIDIASEVNCDAVKFQKRTIDIVYSQEEMEKPRESPFGSTNGDLKRALEFGLKEYKEIDEYCKKKNILWFASCWDEESVDFIDQFNPPCYKIASASLIDDSLLRHIRTKTKPVILSTGMSTSHQVSHAVKVLGRENLIILHTVSTYPATDEELNLGVINTLRKKFPTTPIGYSGHEKGVAPSTFTVAMGACLIERHVTLDRTMWGTDQAASLEPKGLEMLIRDIKKFELAKGSGIKGVLESELPIIQKLRRRYLSG